MNGWCVSYVVCCVLKGPNLIYIIFTKYFYVQYFFLTCLRVAPGFFHVLFPLTFLFLTKCACFHMWYCLCIAIDTTITDTLRKDLQIFIYFYNRDRLCSLCIAKWGVRNNWRFQKLVFKNTGIRIVSLPLHNKYSVKRCRHLYGKRVRNATTHLADYLLHAPFLKY